VENDEITDDKLAYQRLMLVQDQITRKRKAGFKRKILCPYCGHWNVRGNEFCCDILRRAVICILSARRALAIAEAEERARAN
jgi:hypothetical protein